MLTFTLRKQKEILLKFKLSNIVPLYLCSKTEHLHDAIICKYNKSRVCLFKKQTATEKHQEVPMNGSNAAFLYVPY